MCDKKPTSEMPDFQELEFDRKILLEMRELVELAKALLEALTYLTVSLAEQASGNGEGLAMWNSKATCELIQHADKILGTNIGEKNG